MQYDICIVSSEASFARMLALELSDRGCRVTLTDGRGSLPPAAMYVVDADEFSDFSFEGKTLRYGFCFSEDGEGCLRRPFLLSDFVRACENGGTRGFSLAEGEESVFLDGVRIRLTHLEYLLLARLAAEKGSPVSRKVLLLDVFEGAEDEGLLNVYIHYLRKKLEKNGRRMIFAVRGQGYVLRGEEDEV